MSATLSLAEYAGFLEREYLSTFVADGGAAVKVAVVPSHAEAGELANTIIANARSTGYTSVHIDAGQIRASLVQQVFFAVAAAVDWRSAARAVLRDVANERFGVAIEGAPTLDAIRDAAQVDRHLIRGEILRGLQSSVYQNYRLAKDFRLAMMQYCMSELQSDAGADQIRESLNEWLRGELRLISAVKDKGIFQKIGRHNARVMVASTAEWLRQAGGNGLLMVMDIDRLSYANRRDVAEGLHYTTAHVMDTYEVLRQFIDATDEMVGVMLLVTAPRELLDDDRRGFPAYQALQNRIWDDVRDRARQNPYAPMVRLSTAEQDV